VTNDFWRGDGPDFWPGLFAGILFGLAPDDWRFEIFELHRAKALGNDTLQPSRLGQRKIIGPSPSYRRRLMHSA
jgi:hypothetical protein